MSEKKNSEEQQQQHVDNRIAAVRDLIFGENIQQYNTDFQDLFKKIEALENNVEKNLLDTITDLEAKFTDMESLMEHKIADLNDDLDKKIAELEDEKTDRKKLGKALEKIAQMLQE